jgi:Helix-turn-helix domain
MTKPASPGTPPAGDPRAEDRRCSVNGLVLYRARKGLGLTTAHICARILATGCRMTESRVGKYERGKAGFPRSSALLTALAQAYEITEAELTSPCEICKQPWETGCINHPAPARAAAKVA